MLTHGCRIFLPPVTDGRQFPGPKARDTVPEIDAQASGEGEGDKDRTELSPHLGLHNKHVIAHIWAPGSFSGNRRAIRCWALSADGRDRVGRHSALGAEAARRR